MSTELSPAWVPVHARPWGAVFLSFRYHEHALHLSPPCPQIDPVMHYSHLHSMEKETGTLEDERALSIPSLIHSIHSTIFIEHLPRARQCLQGCGCSREKTE